MFLINAISRETGETVVEAYGSCETYAEAREWADRNEMDARRCGWTWVVVAM